MIDKVGQTQTEAPPQKPPEEKPPEDLVPQLTPAQIAQEAMTTFRTTIDKLVAAGIVKPSDIGHMFERVFPPLRDAASR